MMKNAVKTLAAAVAAALMLAGCAEKKETSLAEETSSSTVSTTSSSSSSSTATTTSSSSSKPASTATSSTSTTTTASTTTTTTTTSSSTSAAASSPVSSTTSSVKSSSSSKSSSVKPAETVKTHDCKKDGHVWGKSYTKTETTSTTIEEVHEIAGNGFDYDLADKYFGIKTVNWSDVFGPGHVWGSSSTMVKTTATKTTTKYFHDCTECGKSEQYDTTETVDPGTNWVRVKPTDNPYYSTIWYDINNVPQSVRNAVAQDDADLDDWLSQLAS